MSEATQCPVDPAQNEEHGLHAGQPSHGQEPVGCLILRFRQRISQETATLVREQMAPLAAKLNLETLVLDQGAEAEIRYRQDPIIAALQEQTAALNRLASSNESLSQAVSSLIDEMANAEEQDSDAEPSTYLDGSRVR